MSDFPLGFDYETLKTDEDRELRKLALTLYSGYTADCIREKYLVADDDWPEYKRKVLELISRKLPEADFMKAVRKLNDETPTLIY